jgi:hypothetical protein
MEFMDVLPDILSLATASTSTRNDVSTAPMRPHLLCLCARISDMAHVVGNIFVAFAAIGRSCGNLVKNLHQALE